MGNCSVDVSYIDGELYMEIIPNETVTTNSSVDVVLVKIDESEIVSTDAVIKMSNNAEEVKKAREKGEAVIIFGRK